jgi:hypothetical protein
MDTDRAMTKRERYLRLLRGETVDEIVWAPNFDYWYNVSTAEGTIPEKFRGMSCNDIIRAIGGTIWRRVGALRSIVDPSVKTRSFEADGSVVHEIETPVGTVRSVHSPTEGPRRSKACTEHYVKDLESLRVMQYVADATHYELTPAHVDKALQEVGDDGIVLTFSFCVPFIQFAKTDAGYVNGIYLWSDYRDEVDRLIQTYHRNFIQGYRELAKSALDVISTGDNMDGVTMSPSLFREYAIPFYQEAKDVIHDGGKVFAGHWCGRTESLLDLVPGCGLDMVEAIVTAPMASITLNEALDRLKGEVTLQGGIPAVMVCEEGCSRQEFESYIKDVILPLKGRKGFVLGMSDNVPPNADFARVEAVAGLLAG